MFRVSKVYTANYNSTARFNINQGGTSSGKTYSLIQLMFTLAMQNAGCIITVTAQDVPNLKRGAYRDAKNIWGGSTTLKQWFGRPNESERYFTCRNGSVIEFTSFQDEQDAKGGKRDFLFVNEADAFSYDVFRQLEQRTYGRVYVDYNPSTRFWVHDELINRENAKLFISDHRHNPFLDADAHARIEAIDDPEFFRVYARGLTGRLEGLVYQNYDIVPEMPETFKKEWFGLDFGFTNDPTALVRVCLAGGELYFDELISERGLLNSQIAKRMREHGLTRRSDIIADSAEPKSIKELQVLGFRVEGAQKGADSIRTGIDILKRYKLHITRRSSLIRKEVASYRWGKDRKTGLITNAPIDMFNHTLDAARYVALNRLQERRVSRGARASTTSYYNN